MAFENKKGETSHWKIIFPSSINNLETKQRRESKSIPLFCLEMGKGETNSMVERDVQFPPNISTSDAFQWGTEKKNYFATLYTVRIFPKRYAWLSVIFLSFVSFEQVTGNNGFLVSESS